MPTTIDHALRWWAIEHPERTMLSFAGDAVSYAEMDGWVGRVAARFAAIGLEPGERMVIVAENSLAWCVSMLAAIRAGGLSAGLSTRLVMSELRWILGDYRPRVIVHDDGARPKLDAPDGAAFIHVDAVMALRRAPAADMDVELDGEQPMLIVTTSGSTARPKGVVFCHRAIFESNAWQALSDPLTEPYARLIVAPMSTSAGAIPFLHCLLCGGSAYLEEKFDARTALGLIVDHRINVVTGAPIFFQRMADLPAFETAELSHLRIAHTGGATVVQPLLRKWAAKGVMLRQMYGQTECGGTGVVNSPRHALIHPDRCGGPTMFTDVIIVDREGHRLPAGEQGEIWLRGPGFMSGYWRNPEATAAAIDAGGWLHTGDIGVLDERGLLRMVDRLKDIIISGGLNISAAEVERVILELDGIEEAAVIAARDERFGEVAMAVVHGPAVPDTARIIAHCDTHLSNYKVPRYLIRSAEPLPRLTSGKISKPALRAVHGGDSPLPPKVR